MTAKHDGAKRISASPTFAEPRHGDRDSARIEFTASAQSEAVASELMHSVVDKATDLYISTVYGRLAIDYTVLGLWDAMTTTIAKAGMQHDNPSMLWKAPSPSPSPVPTVMTPVSSIVSTDATSPALAAVSGGAVSARSGKRGKPTRSVRITASATKGTKSNDDAAVTKSPINEPVTVTGIADDTPISAFLGSVGASTATFPYVDPGPSWMPDAAPSRVPCDAHTRHYIALRRRTDTSATTLAASDRPSSHRRRRRQDGSQASTHAVSEGGSRPVSRDSSLNSQQAPFASTQRPALSSSVAKRKSTVDALSPRAGSLPAHRRNESPADGTPTTHQPIDTPHAAVSLSPEDHAILASVEAAEQRKVAAQRLSHVISTQLSDAKSLEKGFVVDGPAGKVIPLVPPEEMLQSAKKLSEPLRFAVAETPSVPPPQTAVPGPPRSGPRVASPNEKKAPPKSSTLRREENFYVPDNTTVTMVVPMTPAGGVSVKDTDGVARSAELRVPKNRMTRQEYASTAEKQQLSRAATPSEGTPAADPQLRDMTTPSPANPLTARAAVKNVASVVKQQLTPRPPSGGGGSGGVTGPAAEYARRPVAASTTSKALQRLPTTAATALPRAAHISPRRKAEARDLAKSLAQALHSKSTSVVVNQTTEVGVDDDARGGV